MKTLLLKTDIFISFIRNCYFVLSAGSATAHRHIAVVEVDGCALDRTKKGGGY